MKGIYFISMILFLFTGCSQDGIVYPNLDEDVLASYKSLDDLVGQVIEVGETNTKYELKVFSEEKWTLKVKDGWCTPSLKDGFKNTIVTLTLTENPTDQVRETSLVFTQAIGERTYELTLEQAPSKAKFAANVQNLSFGVASEELKVSVTTNSQAWEAQLINEVGESLEWASLNANSFKGNQVLSVSALDNNTGVDREGTLVISVADSIYVEIPLLQKGEITPPTATMVDTDAFTLSWTEVAGVAGYVIEASQTEDFSSLVVEESLPAGTISYNLNNLNYNDFVGVLYYRVKAIMKVADSEVYAYSEPKQAHNYFDLNSGTGTTVGDEFQISNARHLRNISKMSTAGNFFIQTQEINLSDVILDPLAATLESNVYTGEFAGNYNGNNNKITNWTLSKTGINACGLFANLAKEGVIKNVVLEQVSVSAAGATGALVGVCRGTIENCKVLSGSVLGSANNVGGLVGVIHAGQILNSENAGATVSSTLDLVGGIVGQVQDDATGDAILIKGCINRATVMGSKAVAGGVIGNVAIANSSTDVTEVSQCANFGTVEAILAPNNSAGGVVGRATTSISITESFNTAHIRSNGSSGGIVGRIGGIESKIENCYNTGTVESISKATNNNGSSAGIASRSTVANNATSQPLEITNCYNAGALIYVSSDFISGILHNVQAKNATMTGCYSLDEADKMQNPSSDKYINSPATSYSNVDASALATEATFVGWDFSTIWEMGAAGPSLKNVVCE